jgi:acyl phosphate:glycerol-3-phosphate acyltransferase
MQTAHYLVALAAGYLLGSIPFGIIITRLAGTQDIRAIGSGSIGATNVLRTGRMGLAAATLIADVLKGTAAVFLASWWCGQDFGQDLGQDCGLIAGLGAFLGHLFPVWLKFKGGKGIATGLGILLAVSWQTAIAVAIIWIAIAAASRYSSLASLIACAAAPVILWFIGTPPQALLFLVLAVLAFIVHRGNIARLSHGTEGKIGQKG